MPTYPLTAILGQEPMLTALLVCAVDPDIGGVLIRGEKGTAKSTAARALAALLPPVSVISGCPFHCDPESPDTLHDECRTRRANGEELVAKRIPAPFVDLPLSATEDRLVGTLHLERTLQSGQRHFEAGLLAAAHRGLLYVDEVNLLPDHLVDILLDVSASGVNQVEREGLRFSHPARFQLIGSMNPEEGELRPQLLDRFGLCVSVTGLTDKRLRYEIVMQRLAFDRDPAAFCAAVQADEKVLREQISQARKAVRTMCTPDRLVEQAVDLAATAGAQGHRAELALIRAARAHAALCGREEPDTDDLAAIADFALTHRMPGITGPAAEESRQRVTALVEASLRPDKERLDRVESAEGALLDNQDFPGSAAAGSLLFTYLKKKRRTASSTPTKAST